MNYNGQLTLMGIFSGCFGGMCRFFMQIHTSPFLVNLLGALVTALICGAAGVAGKEIYVVCKKHIVKKYFNK